jgi:hypothetical protein
LLGGETSPAAFFSYPKTRSARRKAITSFRLPCVPLRPYFLLLYLQQIRRLDLEAAQIDVIGFVLLHPSHRLVVAAAGLILIAELPVGHSLEEAVKAIGRLLLVLYLPLFFPGVPGRNSPLRVPAFDLSL